MSEAAALIGGSAAFAAELGDRVCWSDLYAGDGADVYHALAGLDGHEVREIQAVVRERPGAVLDLAAGSGRLTFPLLALGRDVTALDLSASMLDLLRSRLAQAPLQVRDRCTVVEADMADYELGTRFDTVVLGTTSLSLLGVEERAGLFRRVRHHLAPGGLLVVTLVHLAPDATLEEQEFRLTVGQGEIRMFERVEHDRSARVVTVFSDAGDGGPVVASSTRIRLLPPALVAHEAGSAGLVVADQQELSAVSPRLLSTLCRLEVR